MGGPTELLKSTLDLILTSVCLRRSVHPLPRHQVPSDSQKKRSPGRGPPSSRKQKDKTLDIVNDRAENNRQTEISSGLIMQRISFLQIFFLYWKCLWCQEDSGKKEAMLDGIKKDRMQTGDRQEALWFIQQFKNTMQS